MLVQDVDIVMAMTPLTREQFDAFSANMNDCPDKLLVRCAPAEPATTVDPNPPSPAVDLQFPDAGFARPLHLRKGFPSAACIAAHGPASVGGTATPCDQ
jgi:hypothetical protein